MFKTAADCAEIIKAGDTETLAFAMTLFSPFSDNEQERMKHAMIVAELDRRGELAK